MTKRKLNSILKSQCDGAIGSIPLLFSHSENYPRPKIYHSIDISPEGLRSFPLLDFDHWHFYLVSVRTSNISLLNGCAICWSDLDREFIKDLFK